MKRHTQSLHLAYPIAAPPLDRRFANLLGVKVSAVNMATALDAADRWISASAGCRYICMTGVHGVMEAHRDAEFRSILNAALINAPDGMPLSWVGRFQGHRQMDRVYGPDFMAEMCRLSVEKGYRHYLYGGHPGVAVALKNVLEARFPGLQIVGVRTPPFRHLTHGEELEFLMDIRRSQPHILWVGLGTPKQERFMAEYVERLRVPLMVGIGAAFDFHTGRIRDCSHWVKRAGLQWVHRLLQDPRRLSKRYLRNNPAFVWHIVLQLLQGGRSPACMKAPGRNSNVQSNV